MMDREIEVPEVEGKTIQSMRIALSSRAETEIQIDFTDGTSFSSSTCPRIDFDAELYIGGSGEPQIVKKYGDDRTPFPCTMGPVITGGNNCESESYWTRFPVDF